MKKENDLHERTYNAIWNQYLYLASQRERFEHKFEILLVLTGIYVAVFFQLGLYRTHFLNYLPLFVSFLIFILALYRIIPRKFTVPWVSKEEFDEYQNSEKVHKQLVEECYRFIDEINHVKARETFYLKIITLSLLFSVLFPIGVETYNYSIWLCVAVFLLMVVLEIIFYEKFEKPL